MEWLCVQQCFDVVELTAGNDDVESLGERPGGRQTRLTSWCGSATGCPTR